MVIRNNDSSDIFAEQVRLLYANSIVPIPVAVAVGAIVCWVLQDSVPKPQLINWFFLLFTVSLIRVIILFLYYNRKQNPGNNSQWYRNFLLGSYAVAIIWGIASLFLYPHHDHQAQVIFILGITAMSAGAIAALCPSLPIVSGYLVLLLLPLAMNLFYYGSNYSIFLGLLILLFLAVSLSIAIRMSRNVLENILLRFQSIEREKTLRASQDRYQHIFDNAPLGIFHYDTTSTVISCNDAFIDIIGSSREALIGFNMLANIKQGGVITAVRESLAKGEGFFEGDYSSVTSNKKTPVRSFFKAIRDRDQSIIGGVGILEDFTEKKLSEKQLRYHASYDSLTGLPNRRLLMTQLSKEISRAMRHRRYGALIFLDLDNFKTVNDSLGHSVGDQLLKRIANRLTENTRKEDCVARMGGDEFIIILTELDNDLNRAAEKARQGAENIRNYIAASCTIEGYEMHITPSIGVSMFPKPDKDAEDILKQADAAMYKAKGSGTNEIHFFLPSMQKAADERLQLTSDIRKALKNEEFTVWYQPQVDYSGAIMGAEALIRWHHPDRGLIAPDTFLDVAEETGLMWDIGQWVLASVCEQIHRWSKAGLLSEHLVISVNISAKEFAAPYFVQSVRSVLDDTNIDPSFLGIELTEGSLVTTGREVVDRINTLRRLGIKFSVDDFGTGYSSLHYLQSLPLNTIKIDRSFVNRIGDGLNNVVLVDTIIMMAHNLGLEVIAEGVETAEELAYLNTRNCKRYQGFYFCKPVEVKTFTSLLKAKTCKR